MTELIRPPMELDIDSILQLQGSSDDDDLDCLPRRTVDEILNDSDSSSSSPSVDALELRRRSLSDLSIPPPPTKSGSFMEEEARLDAEEVPVGSPESLLISQKLTTDETAKPLETRKSSQLEDRFSELQINWYNRRKSGDFSSPSNSGKRNLSRPSPKLFGGVKPNTKPGAALAAAVAASRSIPTPHAAAIKSRRVGSGALQKVSLPSVGDSEIASDECSTFEGLTPANDVSNGDGSEISRCHVKSGLEDEMNSSFQTSWAEPVTRTHSMEEFSRRDEIVEIAQQSSEVCPIQTATSERGQASEVDVAGLSSEGVSAISKPSVSPAIVEPQITSSKIQELLKVDENTEVPVSTDILDEHANSSTANEDDSEVAVKSAPLVSTTSAEKDVPSSPPDEKGEPDIQEIEKHVSTAKEAEDDACSRGDVLELAEDRVAQWETKRGSRRTAKKVRSCMKPLELAEELEKKHASSGLHWEEGAAAQPMRLEGIRRGPPAVGYLQIDPDNAITRIISSQSFRRDHGSPQALAVHVNFIAMGMSKGVVFVVPSKYSAHCADHMDTKMLMLGPQGERSHAPVTSMCFNQQGDLLLVGYGDGHVTVWDVQRVAAAKVITGEHAAPVVHTLFLVQDSQVTRQFKAVTGDSKGLVLLHSFSVVPLLNRFSHKTQCPLDKLKQCLLDGQKTGTVLSASPLIDEWYVSTSISAQGNATASTSGIGGMVGGVVGGVVGGDAGWKLFSEGSSLNEEGVVILVTHQTALVVRLSPTLEVYAQLSRPDGIREGSMPYTAWKCMTHSRENMPGETLDKSSLLAIAWDRKVQVAKLVKSELKIYREWTLDSAAIGVAWLDDQMLVVLTFRGQLCLFAKEGTELHRTSFSVDGFPGEDLVSYHTHFTNIFGNPEKAFHNCVAVRGATIYILGPMHLVVSRLLPWKERIQVLRKAGDWMGALDMAMRLYDGHAHGVIDLPRSLDAIREAIMPYLIELLLSYVDEVFSYISVAFCNQIGKMELVDDPKCVSSSVHSEMEEQFARVGGVAVEFCVHIERNDILFDDIFSKFVAVQHGGTFLELLEPYILKDMLGCLPPEIMQALVEHYSCKGWLQRVEQCVLHMDIASLDFNQVVRLCREHGLYGALIYLFNRGLDDFKTPLEELLVVVRNSQREHAATIGYRMLVYLKYCFSGLAFPPGHGTLPSIRVPSLKTELMHFLLEDSNASDSQFATRLISSTGTCPNLYHLLQLDTEATLEVLRCAFSEEEISKPDNSLHTPVENMEVDKENDSNIIQVTVNTLVHIVDMVISEVDSYSGMDDNGYLESWPLKKDIGHLLEFIGHFVACRRATVSKTILDHILKYLTSENNLPINDKIQKNETLKRREKQVLALLDVVPGDDWNASYVLHLCERAQFYQVCGLIHTTRRQYVAAMDSYMRDVDEPIHAFLFINNMLLQLEDAESSAFRSAIISRIPELVNLSREATLYLVIDHFSVERHHILSGLRSHPKSLFLYLKTTIEVYLSGTLDFSSLTKGDIQEMLGRKVKNQSSNIDSYLEKLSDFPKFLRYNPVDVNDEVVEIYLELLCQYERESVLNFLETFESYRVEHCLRLCQEYGVIDAAAFLLERVGDVGSALLLTLSGLNEKFILLDTAVRSKISDIASGSFTEMKHLNHVLRMEEVNAIRDILHASIGLCQRNTQRLDTEESESLWFWLLDSFCEPLRDSYDDKIIPGNGNHTGLLGASFGIKEDEEACKVKWRISKSHNSAHILRRVFSQFIREVVEGMIGYIRLPTIMLKLLSDNGGQEFGDFKLTILGMLGTYGFERRILDTAKSLIEDDTFYTMSLLKKGVSHGYAPHSLVCCICGCILGKDYSPSSIRVFSCGHATHLQCELQENGASNRVSSAGCPFCMPKKKIQQSRSKSVLSENGLIHKISGQVQGSTTIQHPYEVDLAEKPYGLVQISRFEILTNLEKAHRCLQIENIPQLRLAPPAIYHEKVKKGNDLLAGESNGPTKMEKPNKNKQVKDVKLKGSSLRFPLKSSIFSNERTKRR